MPEVTMVTPLKFPFEKTMRHADVALFLDVVPNRITELIQQGRVRAFRHGGSTWINFADVLEQRVRQAGLAQRAQAKAQEK